MTKEDIRCVIRERKSDFSVEELQRMSHAIISEVLRCEEVQHADCVAAYWSLPDEVSTPDLLDALCGSGKKVYLPVVKGESLQWRRYSGRNSMRKGAFGIMEPSEDADCIWGEWPERSVFLVPGMAFDGEGNRLGRGGGYYDRALGDILRGKCTLIGLCFSFQMVDKVPTDEHDVRMNKIICI